MIDHVSLSVEDFERAKNSYSYYAGFVLSPEGHNIEAVCFKDEC